MKRSIYSFLSFTLAVGILVAVLKVINWIPLTMQKDTLRRYTSIDEVRTTLNIRQIYIPAYFPQNIVWPPSGILAQGRPFPAVVMEFKNRDSGAVVLVLSQSRGGPSPAGSAAEVAAVRETVPFSMKGRRAVLVVGECAKGEACSRITWSEDGYEINALMKAAPSQLTRIAESMVR